MAKRALIVGINYPGTSHALRGCVNDANLIKETITKEFGFEDIRMLLDNDATTVAIMSGLNWLVDGAAPGDILYFHYSGHGSQMYDDEHGEEADGLDEIICPVDLNWRDKVIRDDDMKAIFDRVPNGVNLTVTLDCCNSGSGLDHANQYQALGPAAGAPELDDGRFLPPPKDIALMESKVDFKPRALQRNVDATGLMISGCQSHQTSADAYIDGRYIGACTHYLVTTLKNAGYAMSYKELVDRMNAHMVKNHFSQRPELNGPAMLFDKQFLQQYVEVASVKPEEVDPHVADVVKPETEVLVDSPAPEKKSKKKLLIGAAIAAAALLIFLLK